MSDPEGYTRVYLPRGIAAHLIRDRMGPNTDGEAVCGTSPRTSVPAGDWYGTGTQVEYENALRLPLCTRCAILTGQGTLR